MAKKFLLIVLAAALLPGCGESLKRGWSNFSAYYNTFYNAKRYFGEGLQSVRGQRVEIHPESIVRIHQAPPPVEDEAFEQAIAKCVQLLQRHPESKWAYPAMLIMGRSNYYLNDFIAALDQFEELQGEDVPPAIKRKAMIWKGRTLLDLHNYNEGLSYLESILQQYPSGWPQSARGELQVLAAEHYALLEQWEQASALLSAGIVNLSDEKLLGRSYFLYGQVLERQHRLAEAYHAFRQVSSFFAGYEYSYYARLKQADVARQQDRLATALSIYRRMLKNDKYFEQRNRLKFEIARTMQRQGKIRPAEQYYYSLLYGDSNSKLRNLQAEIYYQLGKIQSEQYQDYTLAAAYFDTSASLRNQQSFSGTEQAPVLADAYGRYVELKQAIARTDSLLWLGSLPPDKRDSVMAGIVAQKKQHLLEQQQPPKNNRLINQPALPEQQDSTAGRMTTMHGFLNYRNPNLVARGKAQFQAVWGNRPLVDNWRLREANPQPNESADSNKVREQSPDSVLSTETQAPLPDYWEAIPQTAAERDTLKARRAILQYQLGNVFFLRLNKPDSAKTYYQKVVDNQHKPSLRPRAMYALYELFRLAGRADSLRYWKNKITDRYPNSAYARMVTTSAKEDQTRGFSNEAEALRNHFYAIQKAAQPTQAARLRSLALRHRTSKMAPHIHYSAIEQYIANAKAYREIDDFLLGQPEEWPQDSLSFDPSKMTFLLPADSTFKAIYWDSVRTVLAEHDTLFEASPYRSRVEVLREELREPKPSESLATCKDLGIKLQPAPDMEAFMRRVDWSSRPEETSVSGEVVYSFVVDSTGSMISYQLESPRTGLGIEQALEQVIQDSIQFQSLDIRQRFDKLRCRVKFPISR